MEVLLHFRNKITTEILLAYSLCPRKAFLLLLTDERGIIKEYSQILQLKKEANQKNYIESLYQENSDARSYSESNLKSGASYLTNAIITTGNLEASCSVLIKSKGNLSRSKLTYEPVIFAGTQSVEKENKLELMFVNYLLGQLQKKMPEKGTIITANQKAHTVKSGKSHKPLTSIIEQLYEWSQASSIEPPAVILNKHCLYCQFQITCTKKAEQDDNLSLLNGISTQKAILSYEKKGIFTVKQLSYLFRPRKVRKDIKTLPPMAHKVELQALAIRTGNIYLQEIPQIPRQPIELFLDIEGVPDRQQYYLIGLLVCDGKTETYYSFWADSNKDEGQMWQQFLERVRQYPDALIYHYGHYDLRAIGTLNKRYSTEDELLAARLININTFIFGKVYFPVRTNGLKDIGKFLGARWSQPNASGLQSIVWRHYWEAAFESEYKQLLITYNEEDCRALKLLTNELSSIGDRPDAVTSFAFTRQSQKSPPKLGLTKNDNPLHHQLNTILNFSYTNYDKNKICFRPNEIVEKNIKNIWSKKGYEGQRKIKPKATRIVHVPQGEYCPKHSNEPVRTTKYVSKRLIIDLVFTKNGIRKTITEYVGQQGYCSKCGRNHAPPDIRKYGRSQLYGDNFKAWYAYQRVALRLPYHSIADLIEEQFGEKVPASSTAFITDVAIQYAEAESIITQQLLKSPFIHADETTINIHGTTQYVWVFTNGKYVIFKLRKSREATIVHDLLDSYSGVLISDFYPGYDSVHCRQQKCWVHLIRNLNNDLWQAPFDGELEQFILEVKNLFVPIMEAVRWSSKSGHKTLSP